MSTLNTQDGVSTFRRQDCESTVTGQICASSLKSGLHEPLRTQDCLRTLRIWLKACLYLTLAGPPFVGATVSLHTSKKAFLRMCPNR